MKDTDGIAKSLKLTGDIKYIDIVVPSMMKRINRKDGMTCGYAKNHHTAIMTLSTGEDLIVHAYETDTMIVMDWYS